MTMTIFSNIWTFCWDNVDGSSSKFHKFLCVDLFSPGKAERFKYPALDNSDDEEMG